MKKQVRKSEKPLPQVIRRVAEKEQIFDNSIAEVVDGPLKVHNSGPMIEHCCDPQFQEYKFTKFKIKIKHPDNCCMLRNGSIIAVANFASNIFENVFIIGRKFENIKDFFTTPCKSSDIGIYEVYNLSTMNFWPITDVEMKYVPLMQENKFIVFPLLHFE